VPAYATTATGAPEDVETEQKIRRSRRGSIIAPEEPGTQISREEFQDLVRDLDVDGERTGVAQRAGSERDPAADLSPEDLVLKEPKRREKNRRPRNKRHGRSR
jgi:hypothetical protein